MLAVSRNDRALSLTPFNIYVGQLLIILTIVYFPWLDRADVVPTKVEYVLVVAYDCKISLWSPDRHALATLHKGVDHRDRQAIRMKTAIILLAITVVLIRWVDLRCPWNNRDWLFFMALVLLWGPWCLMMKAFIDRFYTIWLQARLGFGNTDDRRVIV